MTDNRIIGLMKRSVVEFFNNNNEHSNDEELVLITDDNTHVMSYNQITGNHKAIINIDGSDKLYIVVYYGYMNEIHIEEYNKTDEKFISLSVLVDF